MSEPKNGLIVDSIGTQRWYQDNQIHREDGPAIIHLGGMQFWYRFNCVHREDGPAEIYPDGTQRWYRFNMLHRKDGPAEVYPSGTQRWYRFNKLHREDGPAEMYFDGTIYWWINDNRLSNPISSYLVELMSEKRELEVELDQKDNLLPPLEKLNLTNFYLNEVCHTPFS